MILLEPTIAMPRYDQVGTQRLLNDLAADMSRSDAQLENAVYQGNRIGAGWDTWFMTTANAFMDARDAYVQLRPQDQDIIARLRSSALDLASSSGNLESAYKRGSTFGAGWDTTLDRKIELVREAAERLYAPLPGGPGPVPPTGPLPPAGGAHDAARGAAQLVRQSLDLIQRVPIDDVGSEHTKQARVDAFQFNKQAQDLLEPHFEGGDPGIISQLRSADASLEDAAWQLARKPSPDGRFNGVDIPGALRDTQAALQALDALAGHPST
jgi:hypothetical protein